MRRNVLSEEHLEQLRAQFDQVEHLGQCHGHYGKLTNSWHR